MKVGLFIPCYIDAFILAVGIATLELLDGGNQWRPSYATAKRQIGRGFGAQPGSPGAVVEQSGHGAVGHYGRQGCS
jgi:hypothetical protein